MLVASRLLLLTFLGFFMWVLVFHSSDYTCSAKVVLSTSYNSFDNIGYHNCLCAGTSKILESSPDSPALHSSISWVEKIVGVLSLGHGNMIVTGFIIVITLLNIVVYKLRKLQEENYGINRNAGSPLSSSRDHLCRQFSFAELQLATNDFDQALVIGKGGFGKVYKGVIDQGARTVAIKRLDSKSKQGASEFWTEVKLLSKCRHGNLVSLIGYCDYFDEMILVYEYVCGGNLQDHLLLKMDGTNIKSPLPWVQRLKICIGAARALDYLHTGTALKNRVIHRDVKSSNILLDKNLEAKVADLGVCKMCPVNHPCTTHVSTDVKGSFGYFDPNYFLTRRLTRKSDVYAFGVVLFEVLCGRPAIDLSLEEDQHGLVGWAQHSIREGRLNHIIDPRLRRQILPNCLMTFVQIANQCLQNRPKERPTMAEIIVTLESALTVQERGNSYMEQKFSDVNGDRRHASGRQSRHFDMKSAKLATFSRLLRHIFPVKPLGNPVHDVKASKKRGDNRCIFNSKLLNKKLLLNKDEDLLQDVSQDWYTASSNLRIFLFDDLKTATRNFSKDMVLGQGGFGTVFLGWIDMERSSPIKGSVARAVAIKKLESNGFQGLEEWQAEVNILGQLSHPNLINLLGYCREDKELILVYDYMRKGCLEQYIYKLGFVELLPWETRLKIAIGTARGLAFLHTSEKKIIYRDLKSSNILLDENFNVKLSDFGLAKSFYGGTHLSTCVKGTYGYAAPEYVATGHLTVKNDIYAFGVVLLEIMTGQLLFDKSRHEGEENLIEWARPLLPNRRNLKRLMDPLLGPNYSPDAAFRCAALILRCLELDPVKRPSIEEVLQALEQINAIK